MLTAISRLWRRTLERAGRAGKKQANKLVKQFLKSPKAPIKRKPKPIKAKVAVKPLKRSRAPRQKIAPKQAIAAKPATLVSLPSDTWLSSYYSSFADDGKLPARRMSYFLYLPEQVAVAPKHERKTFFSLPLIVMLHGCEQNATQFAQGSRMNQLAEKRGYAVLYPQQTLRTDMHRCWKWYDQATQAGGGDVRMILGIIRQVIADHPIDQNRIYICGLSAGAAMANIMALNHPELFAAVGLHSGPMFGAGHSQIGAFGVMQHGATTRVHSAIAEVMKKSPDYPEMPTILIHGMADKIVRPVNQTQLTQQGLLVNRLSPESTLPVITKFAGQIAGDKELSKPDRKPTHAYEIHDYLLKRTPLLRTVQIADLGHAWSGGDGAMTYNSPTGPDASEMLLDFFALHPRSKT